MASEWVELIFDEEITDIPYHIVHHWLYDIVNSVENRVTYDLNPEDWNDADEDTRIMWVGEVFERELDKIDELTEEDRRVISIYWDDIVKLIAESI